MNRTSKILSIAFIITILILLIVVLVELWYISKLEVQINKRDILIKELTISEDLVNEYFNN